MDKITLTALASFPGQLEAYYAAVPADHANWAPDSWAGIPSEPFTPIGQLCHVRDIEIDGYYARIQRILRESNPALASIDGDLPGNVARPQRAPPRGEERSARQPPTPRHCLR